MNLLLGASALRAPSACPSRAAAVAFGAAALWLSGCASPGHPSPPSLQIPRLVNDLTAARSGDQVHLRWTTPARTTDGVEAKAPFTAEICRAPARPPAGTPLRNTQGRPLACNIVATFVVHPGPSETTDTLPATLTTGPRSLLAYRVQLRGALAKTAGPSAAAYTASGPAPPAVTDFRASDTAAGALLQWTAEPASTQRVELTRTPVSAPPRTGTGADAGKQPSRTPNPFRARAASPEPASPRVTPLSTGDVDSGAALDRTAELGATYQYSAQRVLILHLGARTIELRSAPSAPVSLTLRDIFPPAAPAGLLATPGPASIDLSWQPGTEPRIAGYRVYRAGLTSAGSPAPGWQPLTPDQLIPVPAYRDVSGVPGRTYRYRVTALDTTGNESPPSPEVTETLP